MYSGKVEDFLFEYIMPQECSNRTEVRWLKLYSKQNTGIQFVGDNPLSISVWPWNAIKLENAKHINELVKDDYYTVNIDFKQMGVGGNNSWSWKAVPLKGYQILSGKYSYSFKIMPF